MGDLREQVHGQVHRKHTGPLQHKAGRGTAARIFAQLRKRGFGKAPEVMPCIAAGDGYRLGRLAIGRQGHGSCFVRFRHLIAGKAKLFLASNGFIGGRGSLHGDKAGATGIQAGDHGKQAAVIHSGRAAGGYLPGGGHLPAGFIIGFQLYSVSLGDHNGAVEHIGPVAADGQAAVFDRDGIHLGRAAIVAVHGGPGGIAAGDLDHRSLFHRHLGGALIGHIPHGGTHLIVFVGGGGGHRQGCNACRQAKYIVMGCSVKGRGKLALAKLQLLKGLVRVAPKAAQIRAPVAGILQADLIARLQLAAGGGIGPKAFGGKPIV